MKNHKDYIVVTDPPFNAVGDGKTDDTKAIQSAIDSLANGGSVSIPRKEADDVEGAASTTPDNSPGSNESE